MKLTPVIRYYTEVNKIKRDISALDDIKWDTSLNVDGNEHEFIFTSKLMDTKDASIGIKIEFNNWDVDNYVFMPAAVYNGNRFKTYKMSYPPLIRDSKHFAVDMPQHQSDIPHLNIDPGTSRIQFLAGDMSTPCVGVFFKDKKESFFIFAPQQVNGSEVGFDFVESDDRKTAYLTIMIPGVREGLVYWGFESTKKFSEDKPTNYKVGDNISLKLGIYNDDCKDMTNFYSLFTNYRQNYYNSNLINDLPLSKCWELINEKYNLYNWKEEFGFYKVGINEVYLGDMWQAGWVGGGITTHTVMLDGNSEDRLKALRNIELIFDKIQAKSGFIYGCYDGEELYSDTFFDPHPYNMHLIRKSADVLFFTMKTLPYIIELGYDVNFLEGVKKLANAFVTLWNKYGQFGQFIDIETGDILIGNSVSASTAIAGLALAYDYFKDESYKKVASEAGEYYYKNYTSIGISNGGPGEALATCDSESAYGIFESYMTLYKIFGEEKWLSYAKDAANQVLSWVMNYDFKFPKTSLFGRLDIKTSGSVFANCQNKHSSPGIATHSGDMLLNLYRYTKEDKYLYAIRDLAHNVTQYLMTKEKNVPEMVENTMTERVNTSDWLEGVGEVFYGSCWCEVSAQLSYSEVPGLYVDKENNFVFPIDHIDVISYKKENNKLKVEIKNPTKHDLTLKIFVENNKNINYLKDFIKLDIKSEEIKEITL